MSIRDRQEGFEKKFAMDEETKFKAMARRNKLLGLWAAEKLGKTGTDADEQHRPADGSRRARLRRRRPPA